MLAMNIVRIRQSPFRAHCPIVQQYLWPGSQADSSTAKQNIFLRQNKQDKNTSACSIEP